MEDTAKRKRGRPKGVKNSFYGKRSPHAKKKYGKVGRPKGTYKVLIEEGLLKKDNTPKRGRGRPKGSVNKYTLTKVSAEREAILKEDAKRVDLGNKKLTIKLTRKQGEMLKAIQDSPANIIGFGGAFSGGKSYGAISIIVGYAIIFAKSRWGILRKNLITIKQTSYLTFVDICNRRGLIEGVHYKFNATEMRVTFYNGSEIYFKGTETPEDPNMNKLKLELTGCLIEEADETEYRVYTLMRGRVGRRNHLYDARIKKYIDFKPLLLLTFNPSDGWVKHEFYDRWKVGKLPANMLFIRSLPTDNPYNSESYLEALRALPPAEREKYYEGIWEGQAKPNALVPSTWYEEVLTDTYPVLGERKMGVDVALEGGDWTVFSLYIGNVLVDIEIVDDIEVTERTDWVEELRSRAIKYAEMWKVPARNIMGDGVGNGAVFISAMRNKGWFVQTWKSNYSLKNRDEYQRYQNWRNKACWEFRLAMQGELQDPKNKELKIQYKIWSGLKDKTQTVSGATLSIWNEFIKQSNAHTYSTDNVRVDIISKPIIKKILNGQSPDIFDAVIIGSAVNIASTTVVFKHNMYKRR